MNIFKNKTKIAKENSLLRSNNSYPASVDWREKGVVSEVKDQGDCGSCWTFSTTGCLEAHWSIKTGKPPVLLSEQQLIDCAGAFNNFGCNGGLPSQAFEYIRYQGGIDKEDYYPYESVEYKCRYSPDQVGASVPGGFFFFKKIIKPFLENKNKNQISIF